MENPIFDDGDNKLLLTHNDEDHGNVNEYDDYDVLSTSTVKAKNKTR